MKIIRNKLTKFFQKIYYLFCFSLGHEKIVKLLLEKGADPNMENNDGQKPRDVAIEDGMQNIIFNEIYQLFR